MHAITPFLWFDEQAEEAARFYTGLFEESAILAVTRFGENAPRPAGLAMTVQFTLRGQAFTALNGGPQHTFTPAISFMVSCDTQAEIDRLWAALGEGGKEMGCGWIQDRYGLCWQIVPAALGSWMSGGPEACGRVMQALWAMMKLDIDVLERAFRGV
jgi:predicted 3-demethylubiquinone-9 3-methyltransferase (glyoxalase superfamily)